MLTSLLHPWKIGRGKIVLFSIARLRAIDAIILVEIRTHVRSVVDLLPEAKEIELRQRHFRSHQDNEFLSIVNLVRLSKKSADYRDSTEKRDPALVVPFFVRN